MKVNRSIIIKTNPLHMWAELQKISALQQVASPMLVFKPIDGITLPEKWESGQEYALTISFFGILPLGKHTIKIINIDEEQLEILTNESGTLTKVWDHLIKIEVLNNKNIKYTDSVEIKAGILTLFVWLFAYVFYGHRQKKWKEILEQSN